MAVKFFVDKKAHQMFQDLVRLEHSPFHGKHMKDVFIFAMAIGFRLGERRKLESRKDIADIDVFKENERILINSVAVRTEGEAKVLMDEEAVFKIAEEFANGGINLLYEWIFQSKDPVDTLDKKITELMEQENNESIKNEI